MRNDWSTLPKFYEDLCSSRADDGMSLMLDLSRSILQNPEMLHGLHYLTSHAKLCVSLFDYPECARQPGFTVIHLGKERYLFEHTLFHTSEIFEHCNEEVYVARVDSYSVPHEAGADYFCIFTEKLKSTD